MAMAPIASVGWLSVNGVQPVPPLVVFHTPPPAVATRMVLELVGSTAIPVMRPLVSPSLVSPALSELSVVSAAGPSSVHVVEVRDEAGPLTPGVEAHLYGMRGGGAVWL